MPEARIGFAGEVRCERGAAPFSVTLSGATAQGELSCAFTGEVSGEPPARLPDAAIEPLGEGRYRIVSAAGDWLIERATLSITRAVATQFYRVLPPRPLPLAKRLFWRAVLALAASGIGLSLLRTLRGRGGE